MVAPVEVPAAQRRFSAEDWVLLDAMGSMPLPTCTGRFLTMHKRRRKKLTTRSLNQDHAILDDIFHGQVQHILNKCGLWGFNAFTLETVTGGRSLPVLCVHLFHWYGLLDHFQLDVVRVWKLFSLIEEGYHSTNPYHNSIHATDVTQAMHCFLQERKIRQHLQPLEIMAALIGAVAHDLDHPGVNQHFLISTANHLAILYDNMSVLENHHWRSAIGCLLESGLAQQLTPYRNELETQIRSLILATDINRQQEFLVKFKKHIDDDTLDLRNHEDRHFILQIALKCADISNPTRPWDISHKWSLKVCDEFFRQGEFERQLNLPVTSICDQQSTSVAKIQSGFFRFVVTPLYSEWHRFLSSSLSRHMMNLLDINRKKWEAQEAAEQAEETHTELSDAEPERDISEEDELSKAVSDTPTIIDFIPPPTSMLKENRRQSLAVPTVESALGVRRHSVPVNMEQPPISRTIYRRESLPNHRNTPTPSGRSTVSPVLTDSRTSSDHLREEDELMRFGSQSSILSSSSGGHPKSSDDQERPLSAENLLPEPNIASMTSSIAAGRLSSVLHGTSVGPPCKALTRQQTFPPPQPYVRVRYMSATVEMSTCKETPHEGESGSSSSHSSHENISSAVPQYSIPSIAVLSPNNSRASELLVPDISPSNRSTISNNKREQENCDKEKASKIPKLAESDQTFEKENVDPRMLATSNSLTRRRASAPVSFSTVTSVDTIHPAGGALRATDVTSLRRGSVPVEIARQRMDLENRIESINTVSSSDTNNYHDHPRRGSAPTDLPPLKSNERQNLLTRHVSLNGKSSRRKKQLRRRSSGGPETVCLPETSSESCSRLLLLRQPENSDVLLARRRGSLPIEVLTVGHSVC
ncbi:hypothetical protein RN001_009905 [Aquatica leii]|uniref:Phosphodiesterase n=1 Tax=Aquatica leii TaxID=1421715 RepID=A0AAN7PU83_9COLE|nr:hypothetical protein RN001_009905 [Aquatica leii]